MYVMPASLFPFQRVERGSRESARESEREKRERRERVRERERERERERGALAHISHLAQTDNFWYLDSDSCLRCMTCI